MKWHCPELQQGDCQIFPRMEAPQVFFAPMPGFDHSQGPLFSCMYSISNHKLCLLPPTWEGSGSISPRNLLTLFPPSSQPPAVPVLPVPAPSLHGGNLSCASSWLPLLWNSRGCERRCLQFRFKCEHARWATIRGSRDELCAGREQPRLSGLCWK